MIAVDWGTSNFRAFRLSENGLVLDRLSGQYGVLRVPAGDFAKVLRDQVGEWLSEGERHVLICGMAGSRHGWAETKYIPCPASARDLAQSTLEVAFDGARVFLIPGVEGTAPSGQPEVMRGEETATIGVLDSLDGEGLVCLPGTHSKWVDVKQNEIRSFMTCMTGEVFATLRTNTILAQLMTSAEMVDLGVFRKGVVHSAELHGLLHHIFSVRTLALSGKLSADHTASYLSGLLIGHEVRSVMPAAAKVQVVGDESLCSLYAEAIRGCGGFAYLEKSDAAARGMAHIGRMLEWS